MERKIIDLVKSNHPEKKEIFELARMLDKECVPYYFNFDREVKPTPFNLDGMDPETAIKWDSYPFQIMCECPDLNDISVMFSRDDEQLLELFNLTTNEVAKSISAEAALQIIKTHYTK